mgnify:CR=1 FL=1
MGKKVVAAVLCLVTACAAYGCSFRRDEREEYDPTKRYLYIGNYNGGLGDAWLNALADEHMAEHSDVAIRIENGRCWTSPMSSRRIWTERASRSRTR